MLLFLLKFLSLYTSIKVPLVFYYCSTRMILATITTLLFTIFMGPRFISHLYLLKAGGALRVESSPMLAELHEKKRKTPTMGGLLILFAMISALLLWMDLHSSFTLILLVATIWLGLLGGVDDYLKMKYKDAKGLRAWAKLGCQILLGMFLGLYLLWPECSELIHYGTYFPPPVAKGGREVFLTQGVYAQYFLPFKKGAIFTLTGWGLIIGFVMIVVVVTGSSNAVNLTDGLDGLAAGSILLVSLVFAFFAFLSNHVDIAHYLNILYIEGSGEIAVYMCAMMGACLGFLWYNGHPAQVFMGDTGSLALGGLLGITAILLRREFLLVLVGGVFVLEALSVILQVFSYRYRNKRRVFLCAPLHHHFEFKGWPEPKVVLRFWIIGLILALFGIASLKFQ